MDETVFRRFFWYLNRYFMVPVFRMGLGSFIGTPFGGYMMVIKNVGRKTGKTRYTPVNYAIFDGKVYCLAGFGQVSHWYRNLKTNPQVELLMPGRTISGAVEEVADPAERLRVTRQVLINGGFAGLFMGQNPRTASDEALEAAIQDVPLLRIRPTGLGSGPADPGGWLWIFGALATVIAFLLGRCSKKNKCCD